LSKAFVLGTFSLLAGERSWDVAKAGGA